MLEQRVPFFNSSFLLIIFIDFFHFYSARKGIVKLNKDLISKSKQLSD